MQLIEIVLTAQLAITVLGLSGLVIWLRRQIGALKGAVDAQEKAIQAQSEILRGHEGLLKSMEAVLRSTDEPKMLERLKAYKEFVEHEKEAALAAKDEAVRTFARDTLDGLVDAFSATVPYVPTEQRGQIIEATGLRGAFKERLQRLADAAPDLSSGGTMKRSLEILASLKTPKTLEQIGIAPPPTNP